MITRRETDFLVIVNAGCKDADIRHLQTNIAHRCSVQPLPERALLALVPADYIWLVANYKEDQLRDMRPGQRAELHVDTYGRRTFYGKIESIAGATGARFSLLPPDNASGNFVKVAQRVPVRVKISQVPDGVRLGAVGIGPPQNGRLVNGV